MGNFECGLQWVQVHHSHHSPEEVAGSVQHDTSKYRYPCRVADKKEGNISVEVKADNWGQNDRCDGRLEKFESRNGSDEFDVWQAVDQSVFLLGHIRESPESSYSRQSVSMGALQGGCVTW